MRVAFSKPVHAASARIGPHSPNHGTLTAKPSSHHVHVTLRHRTLYLFSKKLRDKSGMETLGSRLVIMPTSHECICCCEVESVVKKKEEDEGFESVCLNV